MLPFSLYLYLSWLLWIESSARHDISIQGASAFVAVLRGRVAAGGGMFGGERGGPAPPRLIHCKRGWVPRINTARVDSTQRTASSAESSRIMLSVITGLQSGYQAISSKMNIKRRIFYLENDLTCDRL